MAVFAPVDSLSEEEVQQPALPKANSTKPKSKSTASKPKAAKATTKPKPKPKAKGEEVDEVEAAEEATPVKKGNRTKETPKAKDCGGVWKHQNWMLLFHAASRHPVSETCAEALTHSAGKQFHDHVWNSVPVIVMRVVR